MSATVVTLKREGFGPIPYTSRVFYENWPQRRNKLDKSVGTTGSKNS